MYLDKNKAVGDFNPRTYERCDKQLREDLIHLLISIHAPTRGATKKYLGQYYRAKIFQSTHLREVRRSYS